jgi:hypothetical protein
VRTKIMNRGRTAAVLPDKPVLPASLVAHTGYGKADLRGRSDVRPHARATDGGKKVGKNAYDHDQYSDLEYDNTKITAADSEANYSERNTEYSDSASTGLDPQSRINVAPEDQVYTDSRGAWVPLPEKDFADADGGQGLRTPSN